MKPLPVDLARRLALSSITFALTLLSFSIPATAGWTLPYNGGITIHSPTYIGGASGRDDERDVDIYPAVAYDPATGRYLAVWLTLRNANSSSDGFDVYGVLLDHAGRKIGGEFRISDDNSAARNGFPAIAAGDGEFAVAWTAAERQCTVHVQRVTDTANRTDGVIASGTVNHHSPNLVYNPSRRRFAVTYVAGDDYMPPTFLGAETDDCGNDPSSSSRIQAAEFHFSDNTLVMHPSIDVSDLSSGAFRPQLAYDHTLDQYLVVWEDRRNAGGQTARFDVYAKRLTGSFTASSDDLVLDSGGDFTNFDSSATWTPRPAVTDGNGKFLATWFSKSTENSAVIWSVQGRQISQSGTPSTAFPIAQMSFAESHVGQSPTGYVSTAYLGTAEEYLVSISSHLESVWGYLSFARIQRVGTDGTLLDQSGRVQSDPRIGSSVDYENDDQIGVGVAANPVSGARVADYFMVYAKHQVNQPAQDFEIWGVRIQTPAPNIRSVYLPQVAR